MAKGKVNKKGNGKKLGATIVKPIFTLDRAIVYATGFALLVGGGYVMYRFVDKGLKSLDGNTEKKSTDVNVSSYGMLPVPGEGKIPPASAFPLKATNLNNPPFDQYTQWLQEIMILGEGRGILPVFGADGKWGYETEAAVKKVFGSSKVTKSDYVAYYNRVVEGAKSLADKTYVVSEEEYNRLKQGAVAGIFGRKLNGITASKLNGITASKLNGIGNITASKLNKLGCACQHK